MLSDPRDCYMHSDGRCLTHAPNHMFQIFSVKLSKIIVDRESVEVYGYIAVRDNLDPLLNYVINYSRDDPIIIEQVHIHTSLQLFSLQFKANLIT
jgi:hypothetical protein